MASSVTLLIILSSCEKSSSTVVQQSDRNTYLETSGKKFDESEFSKWMSKADQQIAYERREKDTYFAYTEGRNQNGFQQFRHVVQPLPVESHSEWGVYWGLDTEEFYLVDLKLQRAGFKRYNLQVFEDSAGNSFHQATWLKKR